MDYQEFRSQYEIQHPSSVPVLRFEMSVFPRWVRWAVMAMFASAAIISGVHTVPTVYATIEASKVAPWVHEAAALASFVAVELAILLSAYLLKHNPWLGWMLLIITSVVASIANLQSSLSAMNGKDGWTQLVAITVGIAAPLIVLASGKLLVNIFNGERSVNGRAEERFRDECRAFDAEVLSAFEKFSKSKKASVLLPTMSASVQPQLPSASAQLSVADTRTHGHGQGYGRTTDAREQVRTYLAEHPAAIAMSSRQLADLLGVGKTTVGEELKAARQMQSGQPVIAQAEEVIKAVDDATRQ